VAFIPADARWYLADIVQEIQVEGDERNVVHINTTLIEASSPEEAFDLAMLIGAEGEQTYDNPEGRCVRFRFRGLGDLKVIHDKLEHGAELAYREGVGVDEAEIESLLKAKEDLAVFAPFQAGCDHPHFSSAEIMEEIYGERPHLRPASHEE